MLPTRPLLHVLVSDLLPTVRREKMSQRAALIMPLNRCTIAMDGLLAAGDTTRQTPAAIVTSVCVQMPDSEDTFFFLLGAGMHKARRGGISTG